MCRRLFPTSLSLFVIAPYKHLNQPRRTFLRLLKMVASKVSWFLTQTRKELNSDDDWYPSGQGADKTSKRD